MSRGKTEDLGRMHGKLTRYYNSRLDKILDENADDDEFLIPLSPAELTAMNNFLKQNEITADVDANEELSDVQRKLQEYRQAGKAKLRAVGE